LIGLPIAAYGAFLFLPIWRLLGEALGAFALFGIVCGPFIFLVKGLIARSNPGPAHSLAKGYFAMSLGSGILLAAAFFFPKFLFFWR
jgi:hypothetical protein